MDLIDRYKVSVQKATAAIKLHRSVWYFKAKPKNDELLCLRMHEIAHTRIRSKRDRRSRAGIHRENYPAVKEINQCWSMNFVSDALYNGYKFRTLTVIDNFS